ncbi:MAG: aryl-sulfate sulfotransferase [Bacteroidia bacterium]|nr:aryl-sulfate sulfotransferase [Bacteroidia bacterium]
MKQKLVAISLFGILFFQGLFSAYSQQWGNYTLIAVQNQTSAKLIDTASATYHSWTLSGSTGYSAYMMPGGKLIRSLTAQNNTFMGGGMTGRLQMVDWNGTVLWDYTYSNSSYNLHHDFCPLPNGNILAIAYEAKTAAEVTTAGCNNSHVMWPDKIVEFQPTGTNSATIVWEWHAWDHLVQDYDASKNNYGVVADHPELLDINYNNTSIVKDWMHMNGIDYNPILDQIAFSCHNLDQIFVIDHSTTTAEAASHSGGLSGKGGDILYRWGDPAHYDAPGTAILNVVHDAHWIPEGYPNAGYLVGFNNNGVSQNQSSVDLVSPPLNGFNYDWTPGSAFSPSSYTLRQTCNGHSNNMGNSEQFPNGNMMVCIAQSGTVYEINSAGTQLWTYTANGTIPQAHRYTSCFVSQDAPAIPTITQNGNTLSSSAGSTYQWYQNGVLIPGATEASYTPTESGYYMVRITDDGDCYKRYSEYFNFSISIGVDTPESQVLTTVFPNPSNGKVYINNIGLNGESFNVEVFDPVGRSILTAANSKEIDLSGYGNGIYLLAIAEQGKSTVYKRIMIIK